MTGLYVIFSNQKQEHLSTRRQGYQQYELDKGFGYVREDHNTDFLGRRHNSQIQMSFQWLDDIKTTANDPNATFFFIETRHRESVSDAIMRGLGLPINRQTAVAIQIDTERRLSTKFKTSSD